MNDLSDSNPALADATTSLAKAPNVGISALKILACICIVHMHCGLPCRLLGVSVHVFMFLAIFLCAGKLEQKGWSYCKHRLKRIAILYFSWGLLAMVPFSVYYGKIEIDKFIFQMVLGSPYDPPLYFLCLLAVYTLIVYGLTSVPLHIRTFVGLCLTVGCLLCQYSGFNLSLVERCAFIPYFPRCTLGRFVELLPSALLAALCGSHYARERVKGMKLCLFGMFAVVVFIPLTVFDEKYGIGGYGYQGCGLFGLAIGMSLLFIAIGDFMEDRASHVHVFRFVHYLSGITVGIYVIHVLIANAFTIILPQLGKGMILVTIVFALSLLITVAMRVSKFTAWLVR